jgi:hypothetical protein
VSDDFADLLRAFIDAEVRFLVVGAHALSVHGVPRATGDLDIWVEAGADNAARIMTALQRFGAPVDQLGITAGDFQREDLVAQLGVPPYRIDILTGLSGVEFKPAWLDRTTASITGVEVPVLGRAALVANKRATGRLKDRADLEALGEG